MRRRSRTVAAVLAAVVIVTVVSALAWQRLGGWHEQSPMGRPTQSSAWDAAGTSTPRPVVASRAPASDLPTAPPPRRWLPDEVGLAPDLKRVFDDHIDSADPRRQQTAVRALAACAPAFMPGSGETPSADALIGALPAQQRTEREAAYRALYARCASLLGIGRDKLTTLQRHLLEHDVWREAGAAAQSDLAAGNADVAERRIGQALASGDPAAVASLAGLMEVWAMRSAGAPASAERLATARALDTALPWVACDLGLACGADSLLALQACASQGRCGGDAVMRWVGDAPAGSAERAAVQAQRERLTRLLKNGRAPTLADLLP